MKTYLHYGTEVIKQYTSDPFQEVLKRQGICLTDLPVMLDCSVEVIKYKKDDCEKYAILHELNVPEEYVQAVYITNHLPDDLDIPALISDVDGQEEGKNPQKMKSKLRMIIDEALNRSQNNLGDFDPFSVKSSFVPKDQLIEETRLELLKMGYPNSKLRIMNRSDLGLDPDFVDKLLDQDPKREIPHELEPPSLER